MSLPGQIQATEEMQLRPRGHLRQDREGEIPWLLPLPFLQSAPRASNPTRKPEHPARGTSIPHSLIRPGAPEVPDMVALRANRLQGNFFFFNGYLSYLCVVVMVGHLFKYAHYFN